MLLRNWYNILKAAAFGGGKSGLTCVSTSGKTFEIYGNSGDSSLAICALPTSAKGYSYIQGYIGSYSSSSFYVHFGSGTTPPTLDDYCLESLISGGISLTTTGGARSIADDTVTVEMTYNLSNTSSADITIGEVGISVPVSYVSNGRYATLIERTVLSEPITIGAGKLATITYTLVYKLPSIPV